MILSFFYAYLKLIKYKINSQKFLFEGFILKKIFFERMMNVNIFELFVNRAMINCFALSC